MISFRANDTLLPALLIAELPMVGIRQNSIGRVKESHNLCKQYINPSADIETMDYHYSWKGDLYVTVYENSIVIGRGSVRARL
jgi:hypothetical protein